MKQLTNIAVLIDADNASHQTIDCILEKIGQLGKITCKKIYGDWGQNNLNSWQSAILSHAIEPMQQFSYVKGKNATDIAMVIEAMDLLHSKQYDGFCLVSSDSDFASLAVRIRRENVPVFGFGKKSAVDSFKQACSEFFAIESLSSTKNKTQNQPKNNQLKFDNKLMNALHDVITNSQPKSSDNWVNYSSINNNFKQKYANIDIQKYGYSKLINIIKNINKFETKVENSNAYVRIKQPNATNSTNTKYSSQQLQQEKQFIKILTNIMLENPKSENGWSNLSYLASQINQHPDIQLKKYGYTKFSDLITAFKLFDIQKKNNNIFVKLKTNVQQKPATKTKQTATVASQTQTPLLLNQQIQICISTAFPADAVLWRLSNHKKVRGDEDMIFYGQTHSEDGSIYLDISEENLNNHSTFLSKFHCQLDAQPIEVQYLTFTLSHETDNIPQKFPIVISINQQELCLFEDEIVIEQTYGQSILLFALVKNNNSWQFFYKKQAINGDLRHICDVFGIEVVEE